MSTVSRAKTRLSLFATGKEDPDVTRPLTLVTGESLREMVVYGRELVVIIDVVAAAVMAVEPRAVRCWRL